MSKLRKVYADDVYAASNGKEFLGKFFALCSEKFSAFFIETSTNHIVPI